MRIGMGMRVVLCMWLCMSAMVCYAQRPKEKPMPRDVPLNVNKESPTPALDKSAGFSPNAMRPKRKKIRFLVKKRTNGLLMGNKCAEDVTHKMGFEYIVLAKGQPGYKNEWQRNWHNLGVKALLFITRGPFWKFAVKKRIKRCKYQTGDYMGYAAPGPSSPPSLTENQDGCLCK